MARFLAHFEKGNQNHAGFHPQASQEFAPHVDILCCPAVGGSAGRRGGSPRPNLELGLFPGRVFAAGLYLIEAQFPPVGPR